MSNKLFRPALSVSLAVLVTLLAVFIPAVPAYADSYTAAFSPAVGLPGTVCTVTGSGWLISGFIEEIITGVYVDGTPVAFSLDVTSGGALSGTVTIPDTASSGTKNITILGLFSGTHDFNNAFTVARASAYLYPNNGQVGAAVHVLGGWAPSEVITSVTVGGVPAAYSLTVNANGVVHGTFTIPAAATGAQDVVITGSVCGARTFTRVLSVVEDFCTPMVAVGPGFTAGLLSDGTITTSTPVWFDPTPVTGVIQIVGNGSGIAGLRPDGTVVTSDGFSGDGIDGWTDIVQLAAGWDFLTGLKADGTVVSTGLFFPGYSINTEGWTDIVRVDANEYHAVGIKSDCTCVATGIDDYGECDISGWRDIVQVAMGSFFTVGLKFDGTCISAGSNSRGQRNVSDWIGITQITAGWDFVAALGSDGAVVATGDNSQGQCNTSGWKPFGIIQLSANFQDLTGLKSDGTVIAIGENGEGQIAGVNGWHLLCPVIHVSAGPNGAITPSGRLMIHYGENQVFNFAPDSGCHVADVLIDGISVGAVNSYTLIDITAGHTVTASFEANAAGWSQTWCLDSDPHTGALSSLVMRKETGEIASALSGAPVIIPGGSSLIWYSDEAAAPLDGVTFPASDPDNTWSVELKTTNWKNSCAVEVGVGDTFGNFIPFSDQSISSRSYSSSGGILEIEVTLGAQTVPQGSYLAIRVTNSGGDAKTIVTAGGVSWFTSPDSDPGYPLPELAAGILLVSGLAGLAAFIIIKRKKGGEETKA
jgi:hypothetical protein